MIRAAMPIMLVATPAAADDLYRRGGWGALAADQRAGNVGDVLTIVVFQQAEATNSAQTSSRKATDIGGSLDVGSIDEAGRATLGGGYAGRGEARRTERLVTRLSVTVTKLLSNGDLVVAGRQRMNVNGERTEIGVRGRVRIADISAENTVLSTSIADAEIDYGGRGFVSRGARPGLINRLFSLLGLG